MTAGLVDARTGGGTPLTPAELRRRWELVLPHREQLLRIARRRVNSREDAEDVVATALLRTVEHPTLDESRVGAFLCTTVVRLAADVHRDRTRQLAVGVRDATRATPAAPVEEAVCDDAEARWLLAQLGDCPERERQVLTARLSGLTPQEVTAQLGLTRKAAENAFTRVRHRAQALVSATLAATGLLARFGRRSGKPALATVPVAAVAALGLAVLGPAAAPRERVPGSPLVLDDGRAPRAATTRTGQQPAPVPSPAPDPAAVRRVLPAAATATAPAPERTEIRFPAVVDRRTVDPGGVTIERRYEESFEDSVRRCLRGLDLTDPTADPCR